MYKGFVVCSWKFIKNKNWIECNGLRVAYTFVLACQSDLNGGYACDETKAKQMFSDVIKQQCKH